MATNTYVELDKVTVGSAVGSITINMGSTISQAYTDLVLVIDGTVGSNCGVQLRFNGDSGSNYSYTRMTGDGSSASSDRSSNATFMELGYYVSTARNMNILNIMNYSNSTTFKTVLNRANAQTVNIGAQAYVELWRSTAAITSITINASGNFSSGTTFSLYGIKAWAAETTPKATGGYVYEDSTYYYHTFGASGTFTPQTNLTNVDYLVIAGGGGGTAAGGGAGGLRSTVDVTGGGGALESKISLNSGTAYTITVGSGGNGGVPTVSDATAGGNSSIAGTGLTTITATGGGLTRMYNSSNGTGASGGSGGGSIELNNVGSTNTGGAGTSGQGYAGGDGTLLGSGVGTYWGGAGGGGAGSVGANGISYRGSAGTCTGGNGGAGVSLPTFANVTGTGISTYYAGGGGGGAEINSLGSAGGSGGGGKGRNDSQAATAGAANTGSGGGGNGPGQGNGQNGGSGLVVIRYAK